MSENLSVPPREAESNFTIFKCLSLLLAGICALCLLVGAGFPAALLLLTFTIGLAIAGPQQWLRWSLVFVVGSCVCAVLAYSLLRQTPQDQIAAGALMFGLVPLAPALLLGMACRLRGKNKV